MPVEALMAPKTAPRSERLNRSAPRFFAAAAGTTTRTPTSARFEYDSFCVRRCVFGYPFVHLESET